MSCSVGSPSDSCRVRVLRMRGRPCGGSSNPSCHNSSRRPSPNSASAPTVIRFSAALRGSPCAAAGRAASDTVRSRALGDDRPGQVRADAAHGLGPSSIASPTGEQRRRWC